MGGKRGEVERYSDLKEKWSEMESLLCPSIRRSSQARALPLPRPSLPSYLLVSNPRTGPVAGHLCIDLELEGEAIGSLGSLVPSNSLESRSLQREAGARPGGVHGMENSRQGYGCRMPLV